MQTSKSWCSYYFDTKSYFNQTSAFGEGTYLSTELGVCLNWSPNGATWPKSLLPHTVSCVAVCEVVSHPTVL